MNRITAGRAKALTDFWRTGRRFLASPLFLWLTFAWFVFQAVWMALSTTPGVAPDEPYHYNLVHLFARNGWLPFIHNQSGYYSLGEIKHSPFILYEYLLSLPYHLFASSSHRLEILRLISVALGVLAFYLANKLAGRLKLSPAVKNLSLFMLINTLMFTFLASSVNYDNLLIPLSLAGLILILDLYEKITSTRILLLSIILLAGCLTAVNFLPIALILFIAAVFRLWRTETAVGRTARLRQFRSVTNLLLLIPLVLLAALFIQRYGINFVRYHTYDPSCDRVNTVSQCQQDAIYRRDTALRQTAQPVAVTPMEYLPRWTWLMNSSIFGILGQFSIIPNKLARYWTELIYIVGVIIIFKFYRRQWRWDLLVTISVFYALVLFAKNYHDYASTGVNYGVQGRYIFPIFPFLLILLNRYMLDGRLNRIFRGVYALFTIAVFLTASLPTYILKFNSAWYTRSAAPINTKIHNTIKKL